MTSIAWAIALYTVATNDPTTPMLMICFGGIIVSSLRELTR